MKCTLVRFPTYEMGLSLVEIVKIGNSVGFPNLRMSNVKNLAGDR